MKKKQVQASLLPEKLPVPEYRKTHLITSAWDGAERRRAIFNLTEAIKDYMRLGEYGKVLDCNLCIAMLASRPSENLEMNRAEFQKVMPGSSLF